MSEKDAKVGAKRGSDSPPDTEAGELAARAMGGAMQSFARLGTIDCTVIMRGPRHAMIVVVRVMDGRQLEVVEPCKSEVVDGRETVMVGLAASKPAIAAMLRAFMKADVFTAYATAMEAWTLRCGPDGELPAIEPRLAPQRREAIVVHAEAKGPPYSCALGMAPIHRDEDGRVRACGPATWLDGEFEGRFGAFLAPRLKEGV